MAGGSGTRFWPRSRVVKPKQYLNIFGDESLLQDTIKRFSPVVSNDKIYIASARSQASVLESQTPEIPKTNLIYEPVGRNTLPCIGLAAMFADLENPESVMIVSPSDHLIKNTSLYCETLVAAVKLAENHQGIVTIGITPTYPATGYGYVQTESEIKENNTIRQFKVKRFVEKPVEKVAQRYLDEGGFYWNSGLFIFKVSVFIEAMKMYSPSVYSGLRKIQEKIGTPDYEETLNSVYPTLENISVDFGIMEHAQNIYLVEGNFDWNDLGGWESVYLADQKDDNGNVSKGKTILLDSKNSYVSTDNGIVAMIGVEDLIVVRNGNSILVCKRDKAEQIKLVVEQLKSFDLKDFL